MPFAHLNLKPYGYVGSCWRNLTDLGDYQTESLRKIWNGPGFQRLRDDLIQGRKPVGCRSCWDMEAAGVVSTRQQCNADFKKFHEEMESPDALVQPLKFASIEIRFHNECNLMCRHCNPFNSSRLDQLARNNPSLAAMYGGYMDYDGISEIVRLSPAVVEELCSTILPATRHLILTGGEPLLQAEHLEMLKRLEPTSSTKTLEYNSNLHTLSHRGESFIPYWKKYERVTLRTSIDGTPETYGYFRVGGKIERVERHLQTLREAFREDEEKLFLQATCTVSVMQITRIPGIVRYFNRLGVFFHSSLVQYPRGLNIQTLPSPLRRQTEKDILSLLRNLETDPSFDEHSFWEDPAHKRRQIERIRSYVGKTLDYLRASSEPGNFMTSETRKWIEVLDDAHQTKFLDVYPEFEPYWSET